MLREQEHCLGKTEAMGNGAAGANGANGKRLRPRDSLARARDDNMRRHGPRRVDDRARRGGDS